MKNYTYIYIHTYIHTYRKYSSIMYISNKRVVYKSRIYIHIIERKKYIHTYIHIYKSKKKKCI